MSQQLNVLAAFEGVLRPYRERGHSVPIPPTVYKYGQINHEPGNQFLNLIIIEKSYPTHNVLNPLPTRPPLSPRCYRPPVSRASYTSLETHSQSTSPRISTSYMGVSYLFLVRRPRFPGWGPGFVGHGTPLIPKPSGEIPGHLSPTSASLSTSQAHGREYLKE